LLLSFELSFESVGWIGAPLSEPFSCVMQVLLPEDEQSIVFVPWSSASERRLLEFFLDILFGK
jgi:hypothetical protein